MKLTSTKAQINCSSHAEAVGEGEQEETNRKERAQALELLVGSLEDSKHLKHKNESNAEELNVLLKKSTDRRPIAQQVASTSKWLEREARTGKTKMRKNRRQDRKPFFSKERISRRRNSGWRHSSHSWRQSRQFPRPTTRTRIWRQQNHWQKKSWC